MFQCGLSWTLYKVSQEHLEKPLVNFSVDLPEDWGMPLGWSLAFVPVLLIIFGFIFHLLWKSRGMPFKMVSSSSTLFCEVNFPSKRLRDSRYEMLFSLVLCDLSIEKLALQSTDNQVNF